MTIGTSNRLQRISLTGLILLSGVFTIQKEASAVPAFARQTSMPCTACHFQHFPALNTFGRAFRAGGYTMTGGQGLIEGDDLSMPATLNASVIAKLRYVKTNGNSDQGTDRGEIQWPDEAALLIGGRLAEKAGFLMELGLVSGVEDDTANAFLSTKVHFNITQVGNTQLSAIPFSTDGLGSGYGFELLNTGAQRSQRPIEDRKGFSAAQALGLASGAATGLALGSWMGWYRYGGRTIRTRPLLQGCLYALYRKLGHRFWHSILDRRCRSGRWPCRQDDSYRWLGHRRAGTGQCGRHAVGNLRKLRRVLA